LKEEQPILYRIEFKDKTGEEYLDQITNLLENYCRDQKLLLFVQQGVDFIEGFLDFTVNPLERNLVIENFKNEIARIDNKIEIKYCH
jgi:hypothetical protein